MFLIFVKLEYKFIQILFLIFERIEYIIFNENNHEFELTDNDIEISPNLEHKLSLIIVCMYIFKLKRDNAVKIFTNYLDILYLTYNHENLIKSIKIWQLLIPKIKEL